MAIAHGLQALDATTQAADVSIDDSLIQLTTTDPSGCGLVQCFALGVSGSSSIAANEDTIVGTGQAIPGGWVIGGAAGKKASLGIGMTVITGFVPSLQCDQRNGGTAELSARINAWDTAQGTGGCSLPTAPHLGDPDLTPGFQPKWGSPLIDAGLPNEIHALDPTDLLGNPRYVGASADIGAFEYQHQPPTVAAASVTSAFAGVDAPFAVTKASDPDPGDTLTFTWGFDDGGSAAGATVTHAFATPGVHAATVTATDPSGLTGTSTVLVTVLARRTAGSPPPPPPPEDTTAPRLSELKVHKTKLSFTLSEAAKVKVTLEHRVGKHYKKLGAALSHSETKSGAHSLHIKTRLKRHNRYRLTVTAVDAAGNRSKAARVTFEYGG